MERILKIAGIALGVLLIVAIIPIAAAFMGRRAIIDGFEIDGVRIVKDGIVSLAVVAAEPGKVALIDAGNDKAGTAILGELARRQLGPDAVSAIFLTHGHPDHIGAAGLFPNAQVMALESEVALVEGRAAARGPMNRLFPVSPTGVKVTRPLKDGETVTLGQTSIRVYSVPGHTEGSAGYLVNGVLLLGDAGDVASDGSIRGSPWIFSDSQAQDRESLVGLQKRLTQENAEVKVIAFAHSGVLAEGLAPLTAFAQKNQ